MSLNRDSGRFKMEEKEIEHCDITEICSVCKKSFNPDFIDYYEFYEGWICDHCIFGMS